MISNTKMITLTEKIRVLLVDDHLVVRLGLSAMINIQQDMEVVADASNGTVALELYRKLKPDVAIVDLRLPGLSGLEIIEGIRGEFPDARIVVLSSYDGDEDIYRALQLGAMAYLLKDMLSEDLIEVIRAVHAGKRRLPPMVANRLAARLPLSSLTHREKDVLSLIAKGLSNKEIAYSLGISISTVKMHLTTILDKLGVGDRTQAVINALKRGIIRLD
jgi:DNA-binding NarL/FixJ family response regulator